ncbi:MAG: crotonase/enoyl-CoA hydratase family protein [Burkholderiales bacterium]|jgi:enoyl-CoA hydratase
MEFKTLKVALDGQVARIELNRPERANALELAMWMELREAMRWLDETAAARVGVISGAGKHFTAGIDLDMLSGMQAQITDDCDGRSREKLRRVILDLQDTLSSIERCRKPVIAAIHGACVGGGIDLICACDLRYCSSDAFFSVKEIDVGLTADVGTLQRLPHIIGEGAARELAYTGRKVSGAEAKELRLVNQCYPDRDALLAAMRELAATLAAKPPLALRGCKEMITYARDHTVADGLNYVATWNAAMLLSTDLDEALTAGREKRAAKFRD